MSITIRDRRKANLGLCASALAIKRNIPCPIRTGAKPSSMPIFLVWTNCRTPPTMSRDFGYLTVILIADLPLYLNLVSTQDGVWRNENETLLLTCQKAQKRTKLHARNMLVAHAIHAVYDVM